MSTKEPIIIKSPEEIEILSQGGKILAKIVRRLKELVQEGRTTKSIDQEAEKIIKEYDVLPAFKGYRGFPGCVCVSVNQQVVHGIPSERVIREGDIVSLDTGIIFKDYYVDTAVTLGIGRIRAGLQKLLDVTQTALFKGIEQARINNHLSDISHAIQKYVELNGCSVVRDFVGHGIGRNLHESPEIPNFGAAHQGYVLKEGMVLAIEPMVNLGSWQTKISNDGWTVVTMDGKPSAHFEHTIAISTKGPEILTL